MSSLGLEGGWSYGTATSLKLLEKGYSVGGYLDSGVPRYTLYRVMNPAPHFKYEVAHEFDTPEELHMMVRLLLDGE